MEKKPSVSTIACDFYNLPAIADKNTESQMEAKFLMIYTIVEELFIF